MLIMDAPRPVRRRNAFTLVEVLVVVAVVALLAGLAVTRFTGTERRRIVNTFEQAAELLTMLAHRESMGDANLGLMYDAARGELSIVSLIVDDGGNRSWRFDPYVPMLRLPETVELVGVLENGRPIGRGDLFIPMIGRGERPALELLFSASDGLEASVYLAPYAVAAELFYVGRPQPRAVPIDLDELGRDREVW